MIFYFITCFQCALQVTLTFQKLIHFTDWVVGHAHLVMFGVFSMWIFGFMTYLFPRLFGRDWYSQQAGEWHFWLSAVGVFVMFLDLGLAGVFQGYYWASLQPWEVSVNGSQPFWIIADLCRPDDVRRLPVFRLQHLHDLHRGAELAAATSQSAAARRLDMNGGLRNESCLKAKRASCSSLASASLRSRSCRTSSCRC